MFAKFSLSPKLGVGSKKPSERVALRIRHSKENISDLSLVVHPYLIIMDGRKFFINGGSATGELRNPNGTLLQGIE